MSEESQQEIRRLETLVQVLEYKVEHSYQHLYKMICELEMNLDQSKTRYEMFYPQKDLDDD